MKKFKCKKSCLFFLVIFILLCLSLPPPAQPCYIDLTTRNASILFYTVGGYSHRQMIEPLGHALAERGHSVTFFSSEKPTKPNPKFKEFCPEAFRTFMNETAPDVKSWFFKARRFSKYLNLGPSIFIDAYYEPIMCNVTFGSPDFKPWVESSKFDLVIMDAITQKFAYALAYKFNASVIAYSATTFINHEAETWGFPGDTNWAPTISLPNVHSKDPTFFDRVFLTIHPLISKFVMTYITLPRVDVIAREKLELPDMPSINELEQGVKLFFLNQHYSIDYPRSLPPFVIQIGGLHCDVFHSPNKTRKLPKKMEEFIDGAGDNGFIFFSFGSFVIEMSHFPEDIINIFFDSIRGRKTRFLWKWDAKPPKNIPKNVYVSKWFPQQDLLAHPKCRGFISHGGMMSLQQAVANAVPMIILPIFFDQPFNAQNVHQSLETGIHLEFSELTVEKMSGAIDSILNDKKYKDNALMFQDLFLTRPETPLDLAVYWTEYVIRNEDTDFLKPLLAMELYWWQRHLLDVWLFILVASIFYWWAMFRLSKYMLFRYIKPRIEARKARNSKKKDGKLKKS